MNNIALDRLRSRFYHSFSEAPIYDNDGGNYWLPDPSALLSNATIDSFKCGSGARIFEGICAAIEQAREEVLIVTCFWARSPSQQRLGQSLRRLAVSARDDGRLVHVRICFSSLSLWQKLWHTNSPQGQIYAASCWQQKFGLPAEEDLLFSVDGRVTGVQLSIKSRFHRPFSVLHPKFVAIDRRHVLLPSCNVSWEVWFEGCLSLHGPVVMQFLRFFQKYWHTGMTYEPLLATTDDQYEGQKAMTMFLPSPYHQQPRFQLLPWNDGPSAPSTPLNNYILTAIQNSQHTIYIQTPNLTARPVHTALLEAVTRGVDVEIVTSSRMMVLEQLVTAGTITEQVVKGMIRNYQAMKRVGSGETADSAVEEGLLVKLGNLSIRYYQPHAMVEADAVKSHLKLTIVDETITVLGSGNMDRASWYTSQELGLAVESSVLATEIRNQVRQALQGRLGAEQV